MLMTLISCSQPLFNPPHFPLPQDWGENIPIRKNHNQEIYHSIDYYQKNNNIWWQSFSNDQFIQLRHQLFKNNIDLKQAKINIQKSKLNISNINSNMRPSSSLSAGYSASKTTNNHLSFNSESKNAAIGISYEMDYLLKKRDAKYIEFRNYQTSQLELKIKTILQETLLAESYWRLMSLMASKQLQSKLLTLNLKKLNILEARHKEGQITLVDVDIARNDFQQLENQTFAHKRQEQHLRNNIALLTGQIPGQFNQVIPVLSHEVILPKIQAGIPAEVLVNRPDLQVAVINLQNQWQRHITSYKIFFPNISLTGSGGEASLNLIELILSPANIAASISASLPLNYIQKNIERQNLQLNYQTALLNYEKALYQALSETAIALSNIQRIQHESKLLNQRLQTAEDQLYVEQLRWSEGLVSKLNYVQAEISYLQTIEQVRENKLQYFVELMTVYKAVGGITFNDLTTGILDPKAKIYHD